MVNDRSGRKAAAKHCMAVDPLSWTVNSAWMRGYDPRWGGSFRAMDHAIDEIKQRVPANPALGSLLAKSIGLRVFLGRDLVSDVTGISKVLDHAAVTAPDSFYIGQAGIAAKQAKNNQKALGYLSQALRFAPKYSLFLVERGELRITMGDRAGGLADLHRAMALVKDDCDCRDDNRIQELLMGFESIEERRMAFQSEIKSPEQHEWASYRFCETYINDAFDRERALACTKQLTDEFPNSAEALFMRSFVLYRTHDPDAAEVAARFRQVVDTSDERQQQMISELARISSSKEWEPKKPSPR
jgi:tetratricopeptide (TPR) repeat protein